MLLLFRRAAADLRCCMSRAALSAVICPECEVGVFCEECSMDKGMDRENLQVFCLPWWLGGVLL